jgi:hypothetical protein
MLSEVELVHVNSRYTLARTATVTLDELGDTLARLLPEVWGFAMNSGAMIAGAPFTRYLSSQADGTLEIEAGVQVVRPVEQQGEILLVELPECELSARGSEQTGARPPAHVGRSTSPIPARNLTLRSGRRKCTGR